MIKVYLGLPSTGDTVSHQMHQLRKIEEKYKGQVELIWPDMLVQYFGHDYARNCIVEQFLKSDADILWFLDADVTPPENILDLVTKHGDKWQAAGAPYPVVMLQGKDDPTRYLTFTAYKGSNGKAMCPADVPAQGLDMINGVATGCMFLKRGLFLRLQKPYFEFIREPETQKAIQGEDLGFCMKVNELGIGFFVDYSLVCSHRKTIDLLEMSNYAMAYARKSVETYANRIKQELSLQAKAIAEARKPAHSGLWVPK